MIKAKDIIEWCQKNIRQKLVWLEDHEAKHPARVSSQKKYDIQILEAVQADYEDAYQARNNLPPIDREKPVKIIKAQPIVDWCIDAIKDRNNWLFDHGPKSRSKRPEMEIETKESDKDVLIAIRNDYEDAIKARKNPG